MQISPIIRKKDNQVYTIFADATLKDIVKEILAPIKFLPNLRAFFNTKWLLKQVPKYFKERYPKALGYINLIKELPTA